MTHIEYIDTICKNARDASRFAAKRTTVQKNNLLFKIAADLKKKSGFIIAENAKDIKAAQSAGLSAAMIDRLLLDQKRIDGMAASIEEIAKFEDPIGKIEYINQRPSGIRVGRMRIPIGVVAVIYESRPNVTTDIAALCIKSGNASILRGGKEAFYSNTALYAVIRDALVESGCPEGLVILVESTDRELVPVLLKRDDSIDIVIPRGGEELIKMVCRESAIPVIKHDKGVCHIFIDESAVEDMANKIVINAKVQRPGVCNAAECLLIHEKYPHAVSLLNGLIEKGVEIRGCGRTQKILPGKIKPALQDDWGKEFLELIIAAKVVSSMDEAMEHIMNYASGHSEAIITSDYMNSERFLREVDSSAVFVNASTRFHDGGEFGLGAEVGISTQKLHARGAMGVEGLTTLKYVIYGKGEIR